MPCIVKNYYGIIFRPVFPAISSQPPSRSARFSPRPPGQAHTCPGPWRLWPRGRRAQGVPGRAQASGAGIGAGRSDVPIADAIQWRAGSPQLRGLM